MPLVCFVLADWYKNAQKVEIEPWPRSVEELQENLSKALASRVNRVCYLDTAVDLFVELRAVKELTQNCRLQVERWEPLEAAERRRNTSGLSSDPGPTVNSTACGAASGWNYLSPEELGSVVQVNVGGKLFSASAETFRRVPDSYLAGIFSGRLPVSRDLQGNIFIDRDPKAFKFILNYLRDSYVQVPRDQCKADELLAEARYFQLPDLERVLLSTWQEVLVLTYFVSGKTNLVSKICIDGPAEVLKQLFSEVVGVLGYEHCSYG
eukprot:CAMPEP_0184289392 /NCGR_PEP_ID=MMETSP1049-20130417/1848_1 /TAXON_ID=77928 /ORGANISM="Proteomonas sulcata, Strain CCMP704" /LENGTH=264 /DNA_ID=CAMNT_0026596181 /DNA_START=138 /DNA_END=929 /DNA_ORIENTATION=-